MDPKENKRALFAPLKPQNGASVEQLRLVKPDKIPDLSLVSCELHETEVGGSRPQILIELSLVTGTLCVS